MENVAAKNRGENVLALRSRRSFLSDVTPTHLLKARMLVFTVSIFRSKSQISVSLPECFRLVARMSMQKTKASMLTSEPPFGGGLHQPPNLIGQ